MTRRIAIGLIRLSAWLLRYHADQSAPVKLIQEAQQLLKLGHRMPAAVVLRCAVEVKLRQLVMAHDLGSGILTIGQSCQVLKQAGVFAQKDDRRIEKVIRPGNRAAHAKLQAGHDVQRMLVRVQELCAWLDELKVEIPESVLLKVAVTGGAA